MKKRLSRIERQIAERNEVRARIMRDAREMRECNNYRNFQSTMELAAGEPDKYVSPFGEVVRYRK